MGELMPVIFDGLIVVLLGGTIFFAARLSLHLKVFRQSRQDLETLIAQLVEQTDKAQTSIQGMRENAKASGRDLQALINEAKSLVDELEIMNEAGNSMANRLERQAQSTARQSSPTFEDPLKDLDEQMPQVDTGAGGIFAIQDRDGGQDFGIEGEDPIPESIRPAARAPEKTEMTSQAEKELYEALQMKKKSDAGGVS